MFVLLLVLFVLLLFATLYSCIVFMCTRRFVSKFFPYLLISFTRIPLMLIIFATTSSFSTAYTHTSRYPLKRLYVATTRSPSSSNENNARIIHTYLYLYRYIRELELHTVHPQPPVNIVTRNLEQSHTNTLYDQQTVRPSNVARHHKPSGGE